MKFNIECPQKHVWGPPGTRVMNVFIKQYIFGKGKGREGKGKREKGNGRKKEGREGKREGKGKREG